MRYAITREVSDTIGRCELTHIDRTPIDVDRARAQHEAYRELLCRMGWTNIHLPALDAAPDAVFVEDVALVTPEVAIITRPGAASRRVESDSIADVLRHFRTVVHVDAPATIDGGDVIVLGRQLWAGRSSRTNAAGAEALRRILEPQGYTIREVTLDACLHLKSAATAVGPNCIILNPEWIDASVFKRLDVLAVDPTEPNAANVLRLGEMVAASAAYPRTRDRIAQRGFRCCGIDSSELARAEGALTCCSLLFDA